MFDLKMNVKVTKHNIRNSMKIIVANFTLALNVFEILMFQMFDLENYRFYISVTVSYIFTVEMCITLIIRHLKFANVCMLTESVYMHSCFMAIVTYARSV